MLGILPNPQATGADHCRPQTNDPLTARGRIQSLKNIFRDFLRYVASTKTNIYIFFEKIADAVIYSCQRFLLNSINLDYHCSIIIICASFCSFYTCRMGSRPLAVLSSMWFCVWPWTPRWSGWRTWDMHVHRRALHLPSGTDTPTQMPQLGVGSASGNLLNKNFMIYWSIH